MSSRAEFSKTTKRTCAERVGYICSNPKCRNPTVGPNAEQGKSTKVGDVAHICAAIEGGPRFDPSQSKEDRKSQSNALWLCGKCHPLVDKDWKNYPASTLQQWKTEAEKQANQAMEAGRAVAPQPIAPPWLFQRWVHETTNDDRYVQRTEYTARLSSWFNDPNCRCISLVGLGGVGKTSLVGYWLKTQHEALTRNFRGLFYWSFYAERSVEIFFKSLISFLNDTDDRGIDPSPNLTLHETLLKEIPKLPPFVIVLDGLEVLQEPANQSRAYGEFIDAGLRDFIFALVTTKKPWLSIVTSRFPLTDLDKARGVRRLGVERVTPEEGAEILHQQGVYGQEEERQQVSDCLEGHPLALRIFAATLPENIRSKPSLHIQTLLLRADSPFPDKLIKLLNFYKANIGFTQDTVISALSLFRSPVKKDFLITFASRFLRDSETEGFTSLNAELLKLASIGLVLRDVISDVEAYSCHPIIRDYFRNAFLKISPEQTAEAARDLVSSRPDDIGLIGAVEIEPLILAIETFLDLGDIGNAKSFYAQRLRKGKVFLELGLPKDGKRMYEAFLRGIESKAAKDVVDPIGARWRYAMDNHSHLDFGHFLGGAIEFSLHLGEHEDARAHIEEALKRNTGSRLYPALRGLAQLNFREGRFQDAVTYAQRALNSITKAGGEWQTQTALACYEIIRAQMYLSDIADARKQLAALSEIKHQLDLPDTQALVAASEIHLSIWEKDLTRVKALAKRINSISRYIISRQIATEVSLLIAESFIYRKMWAQASKRLQEINSFATKQNCPYETCRAQLALECISFLSTRSLDVNRVERVRGISESSGFISLTIDSMLLLQQVGKTSKDEVEHFRQANAYAWSPLMHVLSSAEACREPQVR